MHEVKGAKVHDARLVAIMLTQGVAAILAFSADDFRRYAGIEAVAPANVAQS